jgi:3-hydroxyacyl-[acyl-carrier-protein] dehydratase
LPEPLCDPRAWQDAPLVQTLEQVQTRIPQRFEMALLHGVVHHDPARKLAVGVHQSRPTDFWVRGHIPGRPLMPGVVMVEMSAQLCAWLASFDLPPGNGQLFGFVGIDAVRFRGQVAPGEKVVVVSRMDKLRRGLGSFTTQSFARGELVYEGQILGMVV